MVIEENNNYNNIIINDKNTYIESNTNNECELRSLLTINSKNIIKTKHNHNFSINSNSILKSKSKIFC